MSPARLGFILVSGLLAGAVNALAGGGSFIAFPALLLAGLEPVSANIVSTIGLVPGYIGGTIGYRDQLEGQARRMRLFGLTGLAGGITGAVILLEAPAETFATVVPWLVLGSCLLLAAQPRLATIVARRDPERPDTHLRLTAFLAVFAASVYGSYFGAGLGVIMLAVLGILAPDHLQRLNALKGYLSLVVNGVAVLVFAFGTSVDWRACAALAVGSLIGGNLGARGAKRLPADRLRIVIVVFGLIVSAVLFVKL